MKTRVLVALLLLAICTAIYASEESTDAAERWRKTQELNQMAERFKAETGFEGKINYGYERMKLGSFEGNFNDIQFTADNDTVAFRQACEQVLNKILPHSAATRSQLSMSRITKGWSGYTTDYLQQVNGYRVEGSGFIMITYEEGRKHFSIGDNTVELPDGDSVPVLSYEDAVGIYDENIVDSEAIRNIRKRRPFLRLFFSNIYALEATYIKPDYRLCWVGGYTKRICIDAITGRVYKMINTTLNDELISVSAEVMLGSDNTGSLTTSEVSLDSTWISAMCDSLSVVGSTDNCGNYNFQGNNISDIESYLSSECGIEVHHNDGEWVKHNSPINDLPNLVFNYTDIKGNPSNLYYHALRFRDTIKSVMTLSNSSSYYDSTYSEPIILANCTLDEDENGQITLGTPSLIKITVGNGKYCSTLCHAMTHDMVYRSLHYNLFRDGSTSEIKGAMDEAFSSYFPCMHRNNPHYRSSLYTKDLSDQTLTVANVQISEYSSSTVNEDIYSRYHMRFPLASAWWSLRSHAEFQIPGSTSNVVDTLLVGALGIVRRDIEDNAAYRYKPRYFYNIFMSRVDDDAPYPLNLKQEAIKKAYESRGFHFYPKVESYSVALRPRNSFSPGDEVHVNITEAPQNTAFKVYVIKHDEYTYVNGALASTLNNHFASDFMPITGSTDANGRWNGAIWTIPAIAENAIGNYDIIVDFGSPEEPDGIIHYAFTAADVMDGFDGRTEPGFKVIEPPSIDIVLALDCSPSMTDRSQLARTARQFVA